MDENQHSTKTAQQSFIQYGGVFLILATLTAVEVWLSGPAIELATSLLTPTFLIFSLTKAGLVAAFFMHLRTDNRFYTYIFLSPVLLLWIFAIMAIIS